jgi:hypothetical protein
MSEYRPPDHIGLRDTAFPARGEPWATHGDQKYLHDVDGTFWCPREVAVHLIKRGGYIVADVADQ